MTVQRIDAALGDRIERLVVSHHRRRLHRHGQSRAFEGAGGWAEAGSFAPREGVSAELLVDGAEALPRIAAEIAKAQSHVHVAGWFFSPEFQLGADGPTLRDALATAAESVDVRVLAWAGAPLPLFHPDRGEARAMRDELVRGTRIRVGLDAKERPMHCHHEKLVIVDGRVAFVGGIDLTDFAGDRCDASAHPQRGALGWHDACMRVEGPLVSDAEDHFALRWHEVVGESVAAPEQADAAGGLRAQLVRTIPEHIYEGLPRGEFTILESYLRALRSAERLVYLENQFLWSPEVVAVLAAKLREPPRDDFRVLVVLPSKPNGGSDDTRGQLGVLVEADEQSPGDVSRLLACTLHQQGPGGRPVYVHAKIAIVDDQWLTVGSANLNEHSLFNDTELNVVVRDETFARAARLRLWAEHLEQDESAVGGDPARIVDEVWRPLAEEQEDIRVRQGWSTRRCSRLRHISRRSGALLGPLNGLVVDG